jgi:hypothetical protein
MFISGCFRLIHLTSGYVRVDQVRLRYVMLGQVMPG